MAATRVPLCVSNRPCVSTSCVSTQCVSTCVYLFAKFSSSLVFMADTRGQLCVSSTGFIHVFPVSVFLLYIVYNVFYLFLRDLLYFMADTRDPQHCVFPLNMFLLLNMFQFSISKDEKIVPNLSQGLERGIWG